jgi:general transcription factor 3C polypeptide 3 (transcription factor C subunit 4)
MDSIFGKFHEASSKLKRMITLSPDSPEPYHLLGNMHEENGELDKAAEYLFMSTYLSPPNLEKWLKVGDLSFERKMYSQAAYCFGRALKIASGDPKIMVRRA